MDRGTGRSLWSRAVVGALALVAVTAAVTYTATTWADHLQSAAQRQTLRLLAAQPNWQNFIGAVTAARQHYVTPIGSAQLNAILAGAARGAIAALGDPYSGYFDASQFRQWQQQTSGRYAGIGVTVDEKNGYTYAIGVFPGSPAAETPYEGAGPSDPRGMRPGDRITEVDGKSVVGMPVESVALLVRGAPGTRVTITVLRGNRSLVFGLTRRNIVIPTASARVLRGGIGYLAITGFNDATPHEVAAQIARLNTQHVRAMVLDLRNNPGGLVEDATQVAGDFLGKGLVTYLVFRGGRRTNYVARGPQLVHVPFVVLVNQYSASAAELLAGAIQDSGRAPLIGMRTFGKFIVQQIFPLHGNSGVKLTVAKYYTPKGRNLEKVGLTPDIRVAYPSDLPPSAFGDPSRDPQLARALQVLETRQAPAAA